MVLFQDGWISLQFDDGATPDQIGMSGPQLTSAAEAGIYVRVVIRDSRSNIVSDFDFRGTGSDGTEPYLWRPSGNTYNEVVRAVANISGRSGLTSTVELTF